MYRIHVVPAGGETSLARRGDTKHARGHERYSFRHIGRCDQRADNRRAHHASTINSEDIASVHASILPAEKMIYLENAFSSL